MLGVEHTVIESVELETGERGEEVLLARVRVKAGAASRCSRCHRRCPGYDSSAKPRRWRGLDLGSTRVYLQASTHRVSCPEHGVVVEAVPWARAGSRFTHAFEDTAGSSLFQVGLVIRWVWLRRGVLTRG
ncbi:MAG: transposase family protein [Pseudonocardiales bacterium]|nr:transposase family protein [Pseudonocardiales bacterium]